MPRRFISAKSTYFHPNSATRSRDFVLIFGDEVRTTGNQENGRDRVRYRGRLGWVRSDRLMAQHPLEMYFIDVGQGDAAFIVTPRGRKILVDGGRGDEAFQFLVWKYRLDLQNAQVLDIDLLVVSHVDEDHIRGLVSIVEHPLIRVRNVVHSGIAKYADGFDTDLGNTAGQGQNRMLLTRHDGIGQLAGQNLNQPMTAWRQAITQEPNITYRAVDAGSEPIDVDDPEVSLTVLAPRLSQHQGIPAYQWLGSESKTVNGHSVILRLDYQDLRVLLPGDVNGRGARHLMSDPNFAAGVSAHIFKAPHHGSHDFDLEFLQAVRPQVSVISSGESPDYGHPRANFLGTAGRVSRTDEPLIFSTELVAQFAVDADAEAADADDAPDPTNAAMLGQARRRFKKRLNGLINVRSDGRQIFCARRIAGGSQFVTYQLDAAPRWG